MTYYCCTSTVHCSYCKKAGKPPCCDPYDFKKDMTEVVSKPMLAVFGASLMDLDDKPRRTGRSTMLAFATIAAAMKEPGTHQLIRDHHPTPGADKELSYMISGILQKLQLINFSITTIRGKDMYLTFKEIQ